MKTDTKTLAPDTWKAFTDPKIYEKYLLHYHPETGQVNWRDHWVVRRLTDQEKKEIIRKVNSKVKKHLKMKELISTKLQKSVRESYDLVCQKLDELQVATDSDFKTSCRFRYNPNNDYSTVRIDECSDLESLIHVHAFLTQKERAYQESAEKLEIKEFPLFKWCGYKIDDWCHDIKLRLNVLTHYHSRQKLIKWKDRLSELLTEEDKVKNIISEFKEDLPF